MRLLTALLMGWLACAPAARAEDAKAEFVGASSCVTCHADKGDAFPKTVHGRKLKAVKGVEAEKACESCHGPGSRHAEAAGDKTNPGYAMIKSFNAMLPAKVSETCLTCHKQRDLQNWDVSLHKQNGVSCASCHTVHEGTEPKSLKTSKAETCMQCHKEKRAEFSLPSHHPVLEGKLDCTSCHNPHGGPFSNLKTVSVEETCFQCHAEKAGPFVKEHPPVAEDCATCHKPHGSANERLLVRGQPALCLSCHKWPHEDSGTGAAFKDPSVTLLKRGRCTNCHREIHGSDISGSLRK